MNEQRPHNGEHPSPICFDGLCLSAQNKGKEIVECAQRAEGEGCNKKKGEDFKYPPFILLIGALMCRTRICRYPRTSPKDANLPKKWSFCLLFALFKTPISFSRRCPTFYYGMTSPITLFILTIIVMGIFSFTFTGGGCFLHTKTILYNLTNLKIQHL